MTAPMWDENDVAAPTVRARERAAKQRREVLDLDTLDDGRCIQSSWRAIKPAKPTYESHFGPGGYNRCIGAAEHPNPTHKDEWGNVFIHDEDGRQHVLRTEPMTS